MELLGSDWLGTAHRSGFMKGVTGLFADEAREDVSRLRRDGVTALYAADASPSRCASRSFRMTIA